MILSGDSLIQIMFIVPRVFTACRRGPRMMPPSSLQLQENIFSNIWFKNHEHFLQALKPRAHETVQKIKISFGKFVLEFSFAPITGPGLCFYFLKKSQTLLFSNVQCTFFCTIPAARHHFEVLLHNDVFCNNCTPKLCLHIEVHFQTNAL